MSGTPAQIRQILERISDALAQTAEELRSYAAGHTKAAEIAQRMLKEWETGRQHSLGT
jgi:predicted transcriptional regulator